MSRAIRTAPRALALLGSWGMAVAGPRADAIPGTPSTWALRDVCGKTAPRPRLHPAPARAQLDAQQDLVRREMVESRKAYAVCKMGRYEEAFERFRARCPISRVPYVDATVRRGATRFRSTSPSTSRATSALDRFGGA